MNGSVDRQFHVNPGSGRFAGERQRMFVSVNVIGERGSDRKGLLIAACIRAADIVLIHKDSGVFDLYGEMFGAAVDLPGL